MREYQIRDKYFYNWNMFPYWPYKDKRGIGVNLSDFHGNNDPTWTFIVNGIRYEIEAEKAKKLGKQFTLSGGWQIPNIIPLQEFKVIPTEKPLPKEMQLSLL